MKKISVDLNDIAVEYLDKICKLNRCTISDAVNIAIIALGAEQHPVVPLSEESIYYKVEDSCLSKFGTSVKEWCDINSIDKTKLKSLCKHVDEGGTVIGFGNYKNKWRDKGRVIKTETARIALLLKTDLGIDIIDN